MAFILFIAASCKKPKPCEQTDQVCDQATVTIGNLTADTVFVGLQKNYTDTFVAPGAQYVYKAGKVDITYEKRSCEEKKKSWSTAQLTSSLGHWAYNIDHCDKRVNFRYDDETHVTASLYDDSE